MWVIVQGIRAGSAIVPTVKRDAKWLDGWRKAILVGLIGIILHSVWLWWEWWQATNQAGLWSASVGPVVLRRSQSVHRAGLHGGGRHRLVGNHRRDA